VKVWALVGVTVVGIVAQPVLIVVGGIPLLSRDALDLHRCHHPGTAARW
jgi:CBS-domain-containing membrane protein